MPPKSRKAIYRLSLLGLIWLTGSMLPAAPRTEDSGVFQVNTTTDSHDIVPGDGECKDATGNCSLRAAVEESNALPGPNTIHLPAGTYKIPYQIIVITESLTIYGAGAASTILDAFPNSSFFYVQSPSPFPQVITIANFTIQNAAGGGGIFNRNELILKNCVFNNNSGTQGGGVQVHSKGLLYVDNCTFQHNIATGFSAKGGAIYSEGKITIINSTFQQNIGLGGGINAVGQTTVINSVFYNNQGGAIYNTGALTVTNSTFSGNTTPVSGGGIYSVGISSQISFSTIVNNVSNDDGTGNDDGGGIFSDGTLLIRGVILANNTDFWGEAPDCGGALLSNGYNLIKDLSGCAITLLPSDLFGLDPLLGPLANNGGSTLTHALLPGSPAIDTGSCTDPAGNPVLFDQRGMPRPQGATCDIGAFEFGFRLWLPIILR
jgi:predicted outer membrane repeat protein